MEATRKIVFSKNDFSKFLSKENIEYWLAPKESGYDIPKTMIYGVVLAAAAYVIYKILKKLKVRIDERLVIAVAPYVVFGGCLRVIKDAGVVRSYIFQTPGIYIFGFSVFFAALLISITLQKKFKIEYHKTSFVIGLFTLPFLFSQLDYPMLYGTGIVAFLLIPWIVFFKFVKWSASNKIVTLLHMFDATTTFTVMSFFGYLEQHIIPTIVINIFGPVSFIVLKLIVIVGVLYLIDKLTKDAVDKKFGLYIKLVIGLLGAATATRDIITLAAGI